MVPQWRKNTKFNTKYEFFYKRKYFSINYWMLNSIIWERNKIKYINFYRTSPLRKIIIIKVINYTWGVLVMSIGRWLAMLVRCWFTLNFLWCSRSAADGADVSSLHEFNISIATVPVTQRSKWPKKGCGSQR